MITDLEEFIEFNENPGTPCEIEVNAIRITFAFGRRAVPAIEIYARNKLYKLKMYECIIETKDIEAVVRKLSERMKREINKYYLLCNARGVYDVIWIIREEIERMQYDGILAILHESSPYDDAPDKAIYIACHTELIR